MRKTAASATLVVPKGKKMKVLTHRPRYIEPAVVPEFGEGTSSTAEVKHVAPNVQSAEEAIVVPKVPTVGPAEAKDDKAEEPKVEETIRMPEILSPLVEANCRICKNVLPQLLRGGGWPACWMLCWRLQRP